MGWSCSQKAGRVLERFNELCAKSSGMSNVWEAGGEWYMAEPSRKEYADGAISGSISKFDGDPRGKDSNFVRRAGSFRIEGDGRASRGPALLKRAAASANALFTLDWA